MGSSYTANAQYTITFDQFEKIVPDEVRKMKKEAGKIFSFLTLTYGSTFFTMNDIYEYCFLDNRESSRLFGYMDYDDFKLFEKKLENIYQLFQEAAEEFKRKKGIKVCGEVNFETNEPYLYLYYDDVVCLSDNALLLKEEGIDVVLNLWVEAF